MDELSFRIHGDASALDRALAQVIRFDEAVRGMETDIYSIRNCFAVFDSLSKGIGALEGFPKGDVEALKSALSEVGGLLSGKALSTGAFLTDVTQVAEGMEIITLRSRETGDAVGTFTRETAASGETISRAIPSTAEAMGEACARMQEGMRQTAETARVTAGEITQAVSSVRSNAADPFGFTRPVAGGTSPAPAPPPAPDEAGPYGADTALSVLGERREELLRAMDELMERKARLDAELARTPEGAAFDALKGKIREISAEMETAGKNLDENAGMRLQALLARYEGYRQSLAETERRMASAGQEERARLSRGDLAGAERSQGDLSALQGEAERLRADMRGVNDEIKEIDASAAPLQEKTVRFRTQMMLAREELMRMVADGKAGTPEFMGMAAAAGEMRRNMAVAQGYMAYFGNPNRHLAATKDLLSGVAGGFSLLTGVMGLFNSKSERMREIQTKVQSTMAVVMGLEKTYAMLKKSSTVIIAANEIRTWAAARAQAGENAMSAAGTALAGKQAANLSLVSSAKLFYTRVTEGATVAQAAFNTVAAMNPYLILLSAIGLVVGAVSALSAAFGDGKHEADAFNRSLGNIDFSSEKALENLDALERKIREGAAGTGQYAQAVRRLVEEAEKLGIHISEDRVNGENAGRIAETLKAGQKYLNLLDERKAKEEEIARQREEMAKHLSETLAQIPDGRREYDGSGLIDDWDVPEEVTERLKTHANTLAETYAEEYFSALSAMMEDGKPADYGRADAIARAALVRKGSALGLTYSDLTQTEYADDKSIGDWLEGQAKATATAVESITRDIDALDAEIGRLEADGDALADGTLARYFDATVTAAMGTEQLAERFRQVHEGAGGCVIPIGQVTEGIRGADAAMRKWDGARLDRLGEALRITQEEIDRATGKAGALWSSLSAVDKAKVINIRFDTSQIDTAIGRLREAVTLQERLAAQSLARTVVENLDPRSPGYQTHMQDIRKEYERNEKELEKIRKEQDRVLGRERKKTGADDAKKRADKEKKDAEERKKLAAKLERMVQDASLAAMAEGWEKQDKERRQRHEQRLAELREQKDADIEADKGRGGRQKALIEEKYAAAVRLETAGYEVANAQELRKLLGKYSPEIKAEVNLEKYDGELAALAARYGELEQTARKAAEAMKEGNALTREQEGTMDALVGLDLSRIRAARELTEETIRRGRALEEQAGIILRSQSLEKERADYEGKKGVIEERMAGYGKTAADASRTQEEREEAESRIKELGDALARLRYDTAKKLAGILADTKEGDAMTLGFRSFIDRRQAAEGEYGAKIAALEQNLRFAEESGRTEEKETIARALALARRQKEEALSKMDWEEVRKGLDWDGVFSNLERKGTGALSAIEERLRSLLRTENLTADQARAVSEQLEKVRGVRLENHPLALARDGREKRLEAERTLRGLDTAREGSETLGKASEEARRAEEKGDLTSLAKALGTLVTYTVKNEAGEDREVTETYGDYVKKRNRAQADAESGSGDEDRGKGGVAGKVAEYARAAEGAVDLTRDVLGEFGVDASDLGSNFEGAMQVLEGVGEMSSAMGEIFDNPASALNPEVWVGIGRGLFDTVIGSLKLFGVGKGNMEELQDEIDSLTRSNADLKTALSDLTQALADSDIAQAAENWRKAAENLAEQTENYRTIMLDASRQWERGSHSIGQQLEGLDAFATVSKVTGMSVGSLADFLSLTPEQMKKVRTDATGAYTQIKNAIEEAENEHTGQGLADMLDEYTDSFADKADELADTLREKVTGVSFDSLYDSFVATLKNMDASSQEFAEAFEGYLNDAVISALAENYKDELEQWYERFALAAEDGLTEGERESLMAEKQSIVENALRERDALVDEGLIDASYTSGSGSTKSFQGMSSDTADELSGRFASLQVSSQQTADGVSLITRSMDEIGEAVDGMRLTYEESLLQGSQMLAQMRQISSDVERIRLGTAEMIEIMNGIKKGTDRL